RRFGFLEFVLFVRFLVGFFVFLFVFEDGAAAGRGVGIDFLASNVLLGVDQAGRKHGGFFVADRLVQGVGNAACVVFRIDIGFGGLVNLFSFGIHDFVGRLDGFGRSTSEKPAGQAAA